MVKQLRAARTRQALVLAAAEIFSEDGYALSSLPAISRRAGVSAGALHFHFASKDALAIEVESEARRSVEQLVADRRQSAASALHLVVTVTRDLLVAVAADVVVRAGFRLSVDPSRKSAPGFGCWWRAWVCEQLLRAQREGELAEGVSPDRVAAVIVAATVGFELIGAGDRISPQHVEQFWSLVLPQLASPTHEFAGAARSDS
ncbi:ScbR family autoregulator-binding transcription factor [Streptomyces humi]|uniref:ScbR family autoregulator-binding transcription factor n=1 Tax=Streptomyces humi TaxID=1428620 RepID=UPI0006287691|nr:ScbR family autoregulator-binding transcription factor [Streptomyces humi]